MLQHSWPDDIISSFSCSHKVTYVKPALTLSITDTRTARTSAVNKDCKLGKKTVPKASVPQLDDREQLELL